MLRLRFQKAVLILLPLLRTVRSWVLTFWARVLMYNMPPVSLRLELVMVTVRFLAVTRQKLMNFGHSKRHLTGMLALYPSHGWRAAPGNQAPPIPFPDASWYPWANREIRTSSANHVGLNISSCTIIQKSSRAW